MIDLMHALLPGGGPSAGPAYVAALAVKGTLWIVLAALVSLGLRRGPAAARHLVWGLAVAGLLALPVAPMVLPPLRGPWSGPWSRVAPTGSAADGPVAEVIAPTPAATPRAAAAAATDVARPSATPLPAPPQPSPAAPGWRAWVFPLWATGVLLGMAALVVGLIRIAGLRRRARVVTDRDWLALCAAVAREMNVRRPVTLLRAAGPVMPMTWGLWRHVVLVPADADRWTGARRRDVLRHELAHVARQDCAIQIVARLACAIHWFNPLAWLAARALRVERERACDDRVLGAGARPSDYASHLLDLARAFRAETALAALPMARPSQLAGRLLDVLDAGRRRSLLTGRQIAVAAGVALGAVLTIGAAAPGAAAVAATPTGSGGGRAAAGAGGEWRGAAHGTRAPLSVAPVRAAPAVLEPARALLGDTLPECVGETRREQQHRSVHVNEGIAVTTTVGRCSLWFVAEGPIRFSEDFTDIAHVDPDGSVTLGTDNGEVRRELEITARGGTLQSRYRVNGADRPYDAAARRWVAGALTEMFRSSGVAAEERARWIMQRQGLDGLIAELAELHGDFARRRYVQVVLASEELDAARLSRVLDWAGTNIRSDYELAGVLVTAARGAIDPAAQRAFVAAAASLQSDYERGRVLSTALARADLDARAAEQALKIMQQMRSDYELARLLIQWHRGRGVDDALRPAFFGAVATIESDYERRRVLAAVVAGRTTTPAVVADVLAAAAPIDSDYELAELLVGVAELYPLTETMQPAYFAAVGTLQSGYERGRVLRAVVETPNPPAGVILAVLRAAAEMPSGHDRAEVLVAVASRHRLDDAARAAYRDAARGLSGYDRDRAMRALDEARRVGI